MVVPGAGLVRAPLATGLFGAILGYVMSLRHRAGARHPHLTCRRRLFGGRRDFDSAFKLAVYSFTPAWLAGIFLLLPGLQFLELTGFYGAYILWIGASPLTKVPAEKVPMFTALLVAGAFVLIFISSTLQHTLFGGLGR